jgi:arginyl-tRNA synthetase
LRKAKEENIKPEVNEKQIKGRFGGEEGNELEKILYRFPEIVERAGKEYSSHYIATYLIELASTFNGFYSKNKIVDREDLDSPYKTALTEAFSIVVKNGLNLLGIVAPERM